MLSRVKPLPNIVEHIPETYDLFVRWVESSNELKAAILRNDLDILAYVHSSHQALDCYLMAVRKKLQP